MEEKVRVKVEDKKEPNYNVGRPISLHTYEGVKLFKSVRRAMKRGLVTPQGIVAPKRPFNNRKRTSGREQQLLKERIYGQVRARYSSQ